MKGGFETFKHGYYKSRILSAPIPLAQVAAQQLDQALCCQFFTGRSSSLSTGINVESASLFDMETHR